MSLLYDLINLLHFLKLYCYNSIWISNQSNDCYFVTFEKSLSIEADNCLDQNTLICCLSLLCT